MTSRVVVGIGGRVLAEALTTAVSHDPGLELVAAITDPAQVLLAIGRHRPDVVLVDPVDGERVAAVLAITATYPGTRVVALLSPEHERQRALVSVEGVHLVDPASEGIDGVLRALHDTERSPDESERADEPPPGPDLPGPTTLAPADLQLLRLVAAGLDSVAAARELGTGAGLVRRRLHRICAELQVETPMQAVAVAVRQGVLRLGPPA